MHSRGDFTPQLTADDPVVWGWLEKRPKWSHTEERLLWRTLEAAAPANGNQPGFSRPFAPDRNPAGNAATSAEMEQAIARAEQIANQGDASRPAVLGWVLNRLGQPARSIPLLETAVAKSDDKELKERASFTLFESYLDSGDWRKAEAIFPAATARLTTNEYPDWLGRIAVSAAKAGDRQDALRLWRRVAEIDMTETRNLQPLAIAGLRDELVALYREVQLALPESAIPPKAIAALQSR
jgi:tetratricopeptide (TPR) repeat protein